MAYHQNSSTRVYMSKCHCDVKIVRKFISPFANVHHNYFHVWYIYRIRKNWSDSNLSHVHTDES